MKLEGRQRWALVASAGVGLLLLVATVALPVTWPRVAIMVPFLALVVFTATFSLYVGGGQVSLLPMATVAGYLALGVVPAGWIAFLGSTIHGGIRYLAPGWLREAPTRQRGEALLLGLANAAIQTGAILAAAGIYRMGGGAPPLTSLNIRDWLRVIATGSTFLLINHLLVGAYLAAGGGQRWRDYLEKIPRLFIVEGGPLLLLAPLMALILTRLGWQPFLLFSLLLVAVSLTTFNLDRTQQRLQRRVNELAGLQAIGHSLSTSLDLELVLASVRQEVARLMAADDFYVALYDRENDIVSFPLAYEKGRRVSWQSRRAANGLTERVLAQGEPLLVARNLQGWLREHDVDLIGKGAGCWLGVPLVAGEEILGVIALQAPAGGVYDRSHQQLLQTIAAQASVALQNARLYAQTDEALARRVQELRHILRTIHEGILLLGREGEILAGNRALADFLGVTEAAFSGPLAEARTVGGASLLARCGFEAGELKQLCQQLAQEGSAYRDQTTVPGPPTRPVARTLAPVYDPDSVIVGWLLVFQDMSEEQELDRLRGEMTSMLVHDLRSPLNLIQGAMQQVAFVTSGEKNDEVGLLLEMAQINVERMLEMIDLLLEIGRLESGQILLQRQPVAINELLQETVQQVAPLAQQSAVQVTANTPHPLPAVTGDRDHLSRVLHNLVDNALKFTPDGGHVRVWSRPENGHLLFGVSDDGPGIPIGEQPVLFEKFTQVAGSAGRRKGTGLGLAYCRLAVEAHGGEIWVESEEGAGSTFIVRLPVEEVALAAKAGVSV